MLTVMCVCSPFQVIRHIFNLTVNIHVSTKTCVTGKNWVLHKALSTSHIFRQKGTVYVNIYCQFNECVYEQSKGIATNLLFQHVNNSNTIQRLIIATLFLIAGHVY